MNNVLLVADDDPGIRAIVSATVALEEFTVIQAADGDQAWSLAQQHCPTIALLDVDMPGRTGLDVVRAIRSHPPTAKAKLVLLTGRSTPEDIAAGHAAGADYYLTKPFSPLQLLNIVAP